MARRNAIETDDSAIPAALRRFLWNRVFEISGLGLTGLIIFLGVALASWSVNDPSLSHATANRPSNVLGAMGATVADFFMQPFGLAAIVFLLVPLSWSARLFRHEPIENARSQIVFWLASGFSASVTFAVLPKPAGWALSAGLGGYVGEIFVSALLSLMSALLHGWLAATIIFFGGLTATIASLFRALGLDRETINSAMQALFKRQQKAKPRRKSSGSKLQKLTAWLANKLDRKSARNSKSDADGMSDPVGRFVPLSLRRREPIVDHTGGSDDLQLQAFDEDGFDDGMILQSEQSEHEELSQPAKAITKSPLRLKPKLSVKQFELPSLDLLAEPKKVGRLPELSKEQLQENARQLEGVLDDFGVKGQIINVRPGPVVTLYELEPAPGIKSSRVISLADDIARSMSAVSARVAVVSGRNAIGIELPNTRRETVYLRELFQSETFSKNHTTLSLALGKNIGGEPIFADLARMPHLLIAGTTGSGKSVGINTMILSLLYRLTPEQCKLIMIDPKMLELSVYEGIPHLLAPVVTDPRKAVVALKWAVREMEDRYRKMSKTGVRNVDGYNAKITQLLAKGEKMTRTVQTGFAAETGQPVFEQEDLDLTVMPYIVVIIDEMADLMMVAGKDIEGAVQRLAQMARAAGIHVVMATQRPSVDVITGTIKANFPTRVSFQVTSKIDSRTILGEQGAEQLLGQGDMLYMAGGGRISRLHGPFVSDGEVEAIVNHLKAQGAPEYLEAVTEEEEAADGAEAGSFGSGEGGSGDDLYDQAVAVVLRDKKVSTSYVQRRLQVGYNKAASLIERMEQEGVISGPNGQGKREILVPGDSARV